MNTETTHKKASKTMFLTVNSNIRISIGTKQVYGRVLRIYNHGQVNYDYNSKDAPNTYWDIEYEIDNPAPGRGSIGRWKQNVDGGYCQLA